MAALMFGDFSLSQVTVSSGRGEPGEKAMPSLGDLEKTISELGRADESVGSTLDRR